MGSSNELGLFLRRVIGELSERFIVLLTAASVPQTIYTFTPVAICTHFDI
jgi:hypothetical protein